MLCHILIRRRKEQEEAERTESEEEEEDEDDDEEEELTHWVLPAPVKPGQSTQAPNKENPAKQEVVASSPESDEYVKVPTTVHVTEDIRMPEGKELIEGLEQLTEVSVTKPIKEPTPPPVPELEPVIAPPPPPPPPPPSAPKAEETTPTPTRRRRRDSVVCDRSDRRDSHGKLMDELKQFTNGGARRKTVKRDANGSVERVRRAREQEQMKPEPPKIVEPEKVFSGESLNEERFVQVLKKLLPDGLCKSVPICFVCRKCLLMPRDSNFWSLCNRSMHQEEVP